MIVGDTNTKLIIDNFCGEYAFLSNFFPCKITVAGHTFPSAEAFFQAMKCPERANEFKTLTPKQAKALGRQVQLREDWEEVKDELMYEILCAKFKENKLLGYWLTQTGSAILIESNTWNDTYWGVCDGKGKNMLGIILMRIREEINASNIKKGSI